MSKSNRRLRNVFVVVAMCWTAVACFTMGRVYVDLRDSLRVTAKLDSLRTAGVPVDYQMLDVWYRKRTDPTNTEAWLKVLETLNSPQFKEQSQEVERFSAKYTSSSRTHDQWPGEASVRDLLAQTTELREEIRRLSEARTPVQFPTRFTSIWADLEQLGSLRRAARLIALELEAAIVDQNSAQIAASAQTLFNLSTVFCGEAFIIQRFVAIAVRDLAFEGLKEALERNLLDAAELEMLAQGMSQESPPFKNFSDCVHGELGLALPQFFMPLDISKKNPLTGTRMMYLAASQDTLRYVEYMEKYHGIDGSSMADALEKQETYEYQLKKEMRAAGGLGMREWYVTSVLLPSWREVVVAICRDCQYRHMVLHGVAIRRYQKQFGEFPKNLAALKNVGFDTYEFLPVGDKPMGYKLEGDNVVLWSTSPANGMETMEQPPAIDTFRSRDFVQEYLIWKMVP